MTETALGAALERAGYSKAEMEFWPAVENFIRSGGSVERGTALLQRAANAMRGQGHVRDASDGPRDHADPSHPPSQGPAAIAVNGPLPLAEAGHQTPQVSPPNAADDGRFLRADLRPPMPGKGHIQSADNGHPRPADARQPIASGGANEKLPARAISSVPPAREPSAAYLRAAAQSRLESARTALYLHKTSSGQWWGDVHVYELAGMERDGKVAQAFHKVFGPFNARQEKMKLGELLNEKQQKQIWELANAT
jgi:hypothetical protein